MAARNGKRAGKIGAALFAWYEANARALPWRAPPGAAPPDPYRVWLSEIMLQQTTVATVAPRFAAFLGRWPAVEALAGARLDDVLGEWAGLGYYARARNLHACARAVAASGGFPDTEEGLRALPGIGAYTAAAIAAIAFGRRAVVVDGNVERVMARFFAVATPPPAAKAELYALAGAVWPRARSGDFAQALMDLGALICRPRAPKCGACPLAFACRAHGEGAPEVYPRRAPRVEKPTRHGAAFVLSRPDGAVLLQRRPAQGLLGGMLAAPTGPWGEEGADALAHAPAPAKWERAGAVRHTFTHFRLALDVWRARVDARVAARLDGQWTHDPLAAGLPSVMRKVFERAGGRE